MKLKLGWGKKITLQFATVLLPLATMLLVQALLDIRRSSQLEIAFPQHLTANAAHKDYQAFVAGVADAVDTGKLSAAAMQSLEKTRDRIHQLTIDQPTDEAVRLDHQLQQLCTALGAQADLTALMVHKAQIASLNESIQALDAGHEAQTREVIAQSKRESRLEVSVVVIATALLLLLTVVFLRHLIAGLTKPLNQSIHIARAIAGGNLSASVAPEGDDETSQLLQALATMTSSLRRVVTQVHECSVNLNSATTDIAQGNQELSVRTEQAADNLRQTASSIEQLTITVKQTAGNASQASQLALSASEIASEGGSVMDQVVRVMSDITASSSKIREIIGVIDSIAFQTNILALNAAVEAARAGEQGRGFAVVASEVRSLAQHSAQAANQIKSLINESVSSISTGAQLVGNAGATMQSLVAKVRSVTEYINQIDAASALQSSEIDHVNTAVLQLGSATRQNASLVEKSTLASESMRTQAQSLAQAVDLFNLGHSAQADSASSGRAAGDRSSHSTIGREIIRSSELVPI